MRRWRPWRWSRAFDAGLPPAHVGLHAGPVVFQAGDYFGRTVNIAARISDYARPGEVLVTQETVDLSRSPEVTFTDLGRIDLKGIAEPLHLHAAHRALELILARASWLCRGLAPPPV